MLQYEINEHVFMLDNLLLVLIFFPYLIWSCSKINQKSMVEKSKGLHSLLSAIISFIFLSIFIPLNIPWYFAFIGSFLVGVGKETYDLLHPEKRLFNFKDIFYNTTGIVVVLVCYLIYRTSL